MKEKSNNKIGPFLNRHNNYSIRKFTIGTASILVGTTLIFGLSNEAQAQSNDGSKQAIEQSSDEQAIAPPQTNESQNNTEVKKIEQKPNVDEESVNASSTTKETQDNKVDKTKINDNNEVSDEHKEVEKSDNSKKEDVKVEKVDNKEKVKQEESKDSSNSTKETKKDLHYQDNTRERAASLEATYPSGDVEVDTSAIPEAPQEFITQYNKSTNREKLIHDLLTDSYDEADVAEILKRVNINLNNTTAQEAFKAIMSAGIKYANEQTSRYSVYAVTPSSSNKINNQNVNSVADLKRIVGVNPQNGLTITGRGHTAVDQAPVNYTLHAQPNRRNNTMDFTVTWKVDPSASEHAHMAELAGFNFGSGYNVPSTITGSYTTTGGRTISNNMNMVTQGRFNYPKGYVFTSRLQITRLFVNNGGRIEYRFSFRFEIGMET
nr:YSIRK-type signal peptide-containing protein [Staphylococcus sp. NRL 22/194]